FKKRFTLSQDRIPRRGQLVDQQLAEAIGDEVVEPRLPGQGGLSDTLTACLDRSNHVIVGKFQDELAELDRVGALLVGPNRVVLRDRVNRSSLDNGRRRGTSRREENEQDPPEPVEEDAAIVKEPGAGRVS